MIMYEEIPCTIFTLVETRAFISLQYLYPVSFIRSMNEQLCGWPGGGKRNSGDTRELADTRFRDGDPDAGRVWEKNLYSRFLLKSSGILHGKQDDRNHESLNGPLERIKNQTPKDIVRQIYTKETILSGEVEESVEDAILRVYRQLLK